MPEYSIEDLDTGVIETVVLTIAQRDLYLKENPRKQQIFTKSNGFVAGHANKPDEGFRDILREIKKVNPGSTIDTF